MTTPPLPTGISHFTGVNGVSLAGGTVTSYIPKTTFFKTTWANPTQATSNANPQVLDSSGNAIIYGFGAIRQIVLDSNGETIWDSVTFGGQQTSTTILLNTAESGVWTVPPGVYRLYVEAVGGGGGGANCVAGGSRSGISGGGGGAGGFSSGVFSVTPGQAVSYSVGAGGMAELDGGLTSFGTTMTANGGSGANFSTPQTSVGGLGGTATGGSIANFPGGAGTDGSHLPMTGTTVYQSSGNGGGSYYGAGGTSQNGASGNAGKFPGSGGGGSMDVNITNILFPGGSGAPGQLKITYQG